MIIKTEVILTKIFKINILYKIKLYKVDREETKIDCNIACYLNNDDYIEHLICNFNFQRMKPYTIVNIIYKNVGK